MNGQNYPNYLKKIRPNLAKFDLWTYVALIFFDWDLFGRLF